MKISGEELRQALAEVREEELDAILKAGEDTELEQEIEASMKRMDWEKIHRMAHKQKKKHWGLPRIVAVILAVALVGATTAYAIGKIHQSTVKWNTEPGKNEDGFQFEVVNPIETAPAEEVTEIPGRIQRRYHPTYIAKGFREYGEDWRDKSYRIVYTKKKERLRFEQMVKTEKTMSVPKLNNRKKITVNGCDGQMGTKGEERILWFATSQYAYRLWTKADVEWDEMLRMAESVAVMPPDTIETYYEPAYIPDGYSKWMDNGYKDEWGYGVYYVKNEEQLFYSQGTLIGTIAIDSEGAKRKKVNINGWKGQLNYRKEKKTVIWATNEYSYVVTNFGNMSEKEILKVARSVSETGDKDGLQKKEKN